MLYDDDEFEDVEPDDNWDNNWDDDVRLEDIDFERELFSGYCIEGEVFSQTGRSGENTTKRQAIGEAKSASPTPSDIEIESIIGDDEHVYKTDPDYSAVLASFLCDASEELLANSSMHTIFERVPSSVLETDSFKVVTAYNGDSSFVRSLLKEEEHKLPFGKVLSLNILNWIGKPEYKCFEKWLLLDYRVVLGAALKDRKLNDRALEILNARILKNENLEQIGKKFSITRERARQSILAAYRIVGKALSGCRAEEGLSLRHDDKGVLTVERLEREFGEKWWIVFGLLKTVPFPRIQYISESNSFWLCSKEDADDLKERVRKLPETFLVNELGELLCIPNIKELHLEAVKQQFNCQGDRFYRRRSGTEHICEDILREFFPQGVHIHNEDELTRFRDVAAERYGTDDLPTSLQGLGKKIMEVGVMCDRGRYRPKQEQYISDELFQKLYEYLTHERVLHSYKELFERFEAELRKQGVSNKYYLQGILDEAHCPKCFFKEFRVAYSDAKWVVDSMGFFASEIVSFQEIINSCVVNGSIVYCQELYDKVARKKRFLLKRNSITHPLELYRLMEFLFAFDYRFKDGYISLKRKKF